MGSLIIFIPLLAVMYFVMIRPQQKRAAEHKQVLASLEPGDEIVTSSGIYGIITEFDGPTLFLEVADGIEVKMTKDSIATVVSYDEVQHGDDDDEDDGEEQEDTADADEHKGPIS